MYTRQAPVDTSSLWMHPTIQAWLLILSVVPTAIFIFGLCVEFYLKENGTTTTADVTRVYVRHNSDGPDSYHVEYDFELAGQKYPTHWLYWITGSSVPYNVYREAKSRREIDVLYLAEDPSINRVAESKDPLTMGLFLGISLAFNITVIVMMFAARNKRQEEFERELMLREREEELAGVS